MIFSRYVNTKFVWKWYSHYKI